MKFIKIVLWVSIISFSIQMSLFTLTGNPNHYLFLLPLIGIGWCIYRETTEKEVILPCTENSCMCGTKNCIFWKSLERQNDEAVN